MLFAYDYNDNRIHIDDTQSNKEYFCPYCGAPLITKKGEIRQHHFAHKANHLCSDSWERTGSYDISPWHNEWQKNFPKENQEVKLSLGEIKHRADILTGRTVVEFQHSIMSTGAFDDRNNFYLNLNYKVVWLFDLSEIVKNGKLTYVYTSDGLSFIWNNPKKAFNSYNVKAGCIDLFFQLYDSDSDCIVRVSDVSDFGFERFTTSKMMSKMAFLEYVGLVGGDCPAPDRTDLKSSDRYLHFKQKYNIILSRQQERAIQSIEGAVLLLAVPGSGKTTVLVDRLGYMVCEKGIEPGRIIATTYNKNAAEEMKKRFRNTFGNEAGDQIDFCTINSLSLKIYTRYCESKNYGRRKLVSRKDKRKLFKEIYREYHEKEYPSENDLIELGTAITYAKNMMLSKEQITEIDSEYPKFSLMFQDYCYKLEIQNKMDFDDQMVFAHWILNNDEEEISYWQNRYKYICVDEAQDASKIQHKIIQIIARGNNIFMVGDEDQSIYGFRSAYPKALLNFRADYINPYILLMERNYRSTPQIVEKAQNFISENRGRYEKKMVADRSDGESVELIQVASIEEQYMKILSVARERKKETAFLYRDNESSVVLIDLFMRNGIKFRLKKPEINFFGNSVVRDITAYLSLSINPYDTDSFKRICNKGIFYLKNEQQQYVVQNCEYKKITILDAVESQMQYLPYNDRDRAERLRRVIADINGRKTEDAINSILKHGYESYLKEKNKDYSKIEILLILAKQEPDISKYLNRLKELEMLIGKGFNGDSLITLSTIHSSKGLEYDTVYMVDVYDGRFPSSQRNPFSRSKDDATGEQEERRLFYVGITRAKNKLAMFDIADRPSSYINSLFSKTREEDIDVKLEELTNTHEIIEKACSFGVQSIIASLDFGKTEGIRRVNQQNQKILEERRKKEQEDRKIATDKTYLDCYNEVKDHFTQQDTPIRDSNGMRWIKCEICGQIFPEGEFVSYGGEEHINLGVCKSCRRKH